MWQLDLFPYGSQHRYSSAVYCAETGWATTDIKPGIIVTREAIPVWPIADVKTRTT
jgi:hypothetical protein